MRIECENCSATYTIDDGQLGAEPIGAQCPYCGHVEVVRPGGGSDALGFGGAPPVPSAVPSDDLGMSFDLDAPPADPAHSLGFEGGDDFPPAFDAGSRGPMSSASAPNSFGVAPSPMGPNTSGVGVGLGPDAAFDLGSSAPTSGHGALAESPASCQECGTPLTDEFDKVIGLCELHQQERQGTGGSSIELGGADWHARAPNGAQVGPLGLEELRSRIRSGEIPLTAQFSSDGRSYGSLSDFKEIAYLASLGVGGQAGLGARASYAPARRRFEFGRLLTPLLLLALVGGLGFIAWKQRADLLRLYEGIVASDRTQRPQRPNPLRRYLASWRLAHPDVSGTSGEHLAAADALHVQDRWSAYAQAEHEYQRALLLDEDDPEAIAGYVENLSLWRFSLATPAEIQVARSALEYAMEIAPRSGPVRRAAGALAWASGDLNGCRQGADAALEANRSDARARLILAGCYLEGNVSLATREAETARAAQPELRRSDRILADAHRRAGRFRAAFSVLDERLRADPRNGSIQLQYGELEAELARDDEAEARIRRAAALEGDHQAAWLTLGRLELRRGRASPASTAFRKAVDAATPTGDRGADIYAGWADAELARRSPKRAQALAEHALDIRGRHVGALLASAEALLEVGTATTAEARVRRALDERPNEPASLVLAGMVASRRERVESALAYFRQAVTAAPKDLRLHLLLAAEYLRANRAAQAYATVQKASDIDPGRVKTVPTLGGLELSERALERAIQAFKDSARNPRNAAVAHAVIALLELYRGDDGAAVRASKLALQEDEGSVLGLVVSAWIALDEGRVRDAERTAERLLVVERGNALGYLMRARARARRGEAELARQDLEAALLSNPGLLLAEVRLADLTLDEGGPKAGQARDTLERAFTVEPGLLELRQTLYEHEADG